MNNQENLGRLIVLDTETTGLEPSQGHRIIEVGCVELIERRITSNSFHQYIQPDRLIDDGAIEVHGITNESLADKPRFEEIAQDLADYLRDAEVIIHNAPFDVGFLDAEFARLAEKHTMDALCQVTDTLVMARQKHPGQRNSLDALCTRYDIDNAHRTKHGALLDAEILADVYLAMTGGQKKLSLGMDDEVGDSKVGGIRRLPSDRSVLPIIHATEQELKEHAECLSAIDKASDGQTIWQQN